MAYIPTNLSETYQHLLNPKMQEPFLTSQQPFQHEQKTLSPATLLVLSNSNCCKLPTKQNNYQDHFHDPVQQERNVGCTGKMMKQPNCRRNVTKSFPMKLYEVLSQAEKTGFADAISWQPHGRSFNIRKPKKFVQNVASKYFKQSKLSSFQRQLNIYGFIRLTKGAERGGYYHEFFLRGRPDLIKRIVREPIKGSNFQLSLFSKEPNFATMEICVEGSGQLLLHRNEKEQSLMQLKKSMIETKRQYKFSNTKELLSCDRTNKNFTQSVLDSTLHFPVMEKDQDQFASMIARDKREVSHSFTKTMLEDIPKNLQSDRVTCPNVTPTSSVTQQTISQSSFDIDICSSIPKSSSTQSLQSISSISSSASSLFSLEDLFDLE